MMDNVQVENEFLRNTELIMENQYKVKAYRQVIAAVTQGLLSNPETKIEPFMNPLTADRAIEGYAGTIARMTGQIMKHVIHTEKSLFESRKALRDVDDANAQEPS